VWTSRRQSQARSGKSSLAALVAVHSDAFATNRSDRKEDLRNSAAVKAKKRNDNIAARNTAVKNKKMGLKPKGDKDKKKGGKSRPGFEGSKGGKKTSK
jgi:hypothetical protein